MGKTLFCENSSGHERTENQGPSEYYHGHYTDRHGRCDVSKHEISKLRIRETSGKDEERCLQTTNLGKYIDGLNETGLRVIGK